MSQDSIAQMIQGVGTFSSAYSESQAIRAQSDYQAQQLDFNSKLAELQAKQSEIIGKKESDENKVKIKQLIGKQRAALAAQGIEVNADSALALQLDTAEQGALDSLTIRNNAFLEATGYRIQSIDLAGQAQQTRISGKASARNTLLTGGISALSSFSSAIAGGSGGGGISQSPSQPGRAVAGQGGYGAGTPKGAYNTGTFTRLR